MKLKLRTQTTDTLKTTLSTISQVRKFVVLRFEPSKLTIILLDEQHVTQEPQVWCRIPIDTIFDQVEIQSLRDNVIQFVVHIELFLRTIRQFDKANSDYLYVRLQKNDVSGNQGTGSKNGRTASLALYYSSINANQSTINHTFRVPIKIIKNAPESVFGSEPDLADVHLMMSLPNEFSLIYKRLEKFKRVSQKEVLKVKASKRDGGFLGFVLEEEGKYNVTVSWNHHLEVLKPDDPQLERSETLTEQASYTQDFEDTEVLLRLKDWQLSSRIVATCKVVILLFTLKGCILHCFLDDHSQTQITYHMAGLIVRD